MQHDDQYIDEEEIETMQSMFQMDEYQLEAWWTQLNESQQARLSSLVQVAIENLEMEARLDEYPECSVMVELATRH